MSKFNYLVSSGEQKLLFIRVNLHVRENSNWHSKGSGKVNKFEEDDIWKNKLTVREYSLVYQYNLTCYQASPRHISSGQLTYLCNSPRTSHAQSQSLSAGKYSSRSIIGRAAYGKLAAGISSSSSLEAKISTILFVALSWTRTHCDTANKKTGLLLRERMYIATDHGRIILLG